MGKRELTVLFDDWDAFEIELSKWNRPVSYLFHWFFYSTANIFAEAEYPFGRQTRL